MSYDIYLVATDALGDEYTLYEVGNYTSNVSRMWADSLGHPLADMHDRRAGDCIAALEAAVARMDGDRRRYEAMDPPNGWGCAEGARDYLARMLDGCRRYPDAVVYISR